MSQVQSPPTSPLSVILVNECATQTIWPAVNANPADPALDPLTPGAKLLPYQSMEIAVPRLWVSGRIWAKQYCEPATGTHCRVGDCGKASCWSVPAPWATLFEINLNGTHADYNLSLVDGFNLGMSFWSNSSCQPLNCSAPPYLGFDTTGTPLCPSDHMVFKKNDYDLANVVGCLSTCTRLHKADCCPEKDRPSCRQFNNPWFQQACPDAYNFPFADNDPDRHLVKACDDMNSFTLTFTC